MRRPLDQSEFSRMSPEAQQRAMQLYPELIDQFGLEGMTTPEVTPEVTPDEENPIFDQFEEAPQEEVETPEMQALAASQQGDIFDEATFQEEAETPEQIPQQAQRTPAVDIGEMLRKQAEETDKLSLLKASAQARNAMLNRKSDMGIYEDMQARIERPLKQLQLEQQLKEDQAKRDPNSQISIMARDTLADLGMDMSRFEGVAFSQIEKLYPTLAQSLYTRVAAQARVAEARIQAESMKNKLVQDLEIAKMKQETEENKLKQQKEDKRLEREDKKIERGLRRQENEFNRALKKDALSLNKETKQFTKDIKTQQTMEATVKVFRDGDDMTRYRQADTVTKLLDDAMNAGNDTSRNERAGAAFMQYGKLAQGDNSVLRPSDIQNLTETYNVTSVKELVDKVGAQLKGGKFTDDNLQAFKDIVQAIKESTGRTLKSRLNPILETADEFQFNLDRVLDPALVEEVYAYPDLDEEDMARIENRKAGKVKTSKGTVKKQTTQQSQIEDIIKRQKSISAELDAKKARQQELLLKKQE